MIVLKNVFEVFKELTEACVNGDFFYAKKI